MIEYTVKVYNNGIKEWWLNGELHREDGPALELSDGSKLWYLHGECHREDGPAVERGDGSKLWYLHGKFHREDGPAVERSDGSKEWYLHGEMLTESEWKEKVSSCVGKIVTIDGKKYRLGLSEEI